MGRISRSVIYLVILSVVILANVERGSTSTVSSSGNPVFRPFKLIKIGFIVKRPQPGGTPKPEGTAKTPASRGWSNPFVLVRPPWILVAPPKRTTATTTTTTTPATTSPKRTVSASLAGHCELICQRGKNSKKYAYTCKDFARVGKYYLCWVCRYRKRVCDILGSGGLIN